eukprot:1660797-Rhodomonas_salina.2
MENTEREESDTCSYASQAERVLGVFKRTPPRPGCKSLLAPCNTEPLFDSSILTSTPQPFSRSSRPAPDSRPPDHPRQAVQILRQRTEFLAPVPLLRVHPAVTNPAFSISAWSAMLPRLRARFVATGGAHSALCARAGSSQCRRAPRLAAEAYSGSRWPTTTNCRAGAGSIQVCWPRSGARPGVDGTKRSVRREPAGA